LRYLLDTNVLKELGKSSPHQSVAAWLETVDDLDLMISVREIWKGIERKRRKDPSLASQLERSAKAIFAAYERRVLPIDENVAERWGVLLGEIEKNIDDTGLAATAYVHRLVMVTRNETDFQGRGVDVLNPFKKPPKIRKA
jgi:predicted nucleic acid-binding protein